MRQGPYMVPHDDVFSLPDGGVAVDLPQSPGYYLGYIYDLTGYAEFYSVHVLKDPPAHLERLRREYPDGSKGFYVYTAANGDVLTMYHCGDPHVHPACGADGRPFLDGYVKYDFKTVRK